MTITAFINDEVLGPHAYTPEGPLGGSGLSPFPSFKPGQVLVGDSEGSLVFVTLGVATAATYNQGDFFCWDNSYNAGPVGEITAVSEYFPGTAVGTLFLGGGVANPSALPAAGNIWSFTFQPGVYGVWMQRYGTSLMNLGALSTGGTLTNPNTTSTNGRITMAAVAAATSFSSAPVGTICNAPLSRTFTANTTNGSAVLTNISTLKYLVKGMQVTGVGIPAVSSTVSGTFIIDIWGSTVFLSQLCTSTNVSSTITALNSQTTGNVVNASNTITNVPQIPGLYPNQIITGTGVIGKVIQSIKGIPGNYSIVMTTNATATNNNVQITLAAAPNYYEGFLRNPYYNIGL